MSQLYEQVKSLLPHIRETIRLASELNAANKRFDIKFPSVTHHIGEHYKEYKDDPDVHYAKQKFIENLESLSYDQVILIEAVMYVGREEKDPEDYERRKREVEEEGGYWDEPEDGVYDSAQKKIFDHMKNLKTTDNTKDASIFSMMGKAPLAKYLQRGIELLKLNR